jgi:hypothetical protein
MCYVGFKTLPYTEFINKDGSVISPSTLCSLYSQEVTSQEKQELEKISKGVNTSIPAQHAATLTGVVVGLTTGMKVFTALTASFLGPFWAPFGIVGLVGYVLSIPLAVKSSLMATVTMKDTTRKLVAYFLSKKVGTSETRKVLTEALKQEKTMLKECEFKKGSPFAGLCSKDQEKLHTLAIEASTMNEFRASIISTANKGTLWKNKHLLAWHFFTAEGKERTPREICKAICNL